MRRKARVDANQSQVVKTLRAAGCWVLDLSRVGEGCPDLLVHGPAFPWPLVLMEVKDESQPPSKRKLTEAQIRFHAGCYGPLVVVKSPEEALRAVGIIT